MLCYIYLLLEQQYGIDRLTVLNSLYLYAKQKDSLCAYTSTSIFPLFEVFANGNLYATVKNSYNCAFSGTLVTFPFNVVEMPLGKRQVAFFNKCVTVL